MRIGFYFNDSGFRDMDLRNPIYGNCGIGGTQYCFIMLADALVKYTKYEVFFYHYNQNHLPEGVVDCIVMDYKEMLKKCAEDNIEIFIFKPEGITEFVKSLRNVSMDCIAWAHNYLLDEEINEFYSNHQLKRIVYVGREEYDRYIDHPAISKMTYIYNMFDGRVFHQRPMPVVPTVTYTGSLVKAKGFHMLANIWPSILKKVPDAQLFVIGNGQIYNRDVKLGSFGIADEQYERMFIDAITKDGKLLPSVHFCGAMGKEKVQIYQKTTVGIMNPSGKTETFGLSAIEMEACGIPVVTRAANGLFDTVIDAETGYLVRNQRQFQNRIVELLIDKSKNTDLGKRAKQFVETSFLPEHLVVKWTRMFDEIKIGIPAKMMKPEKNWWNNLKWIRYINYRIHMAKIPTAPLINIECKIRNLIR